VTAVPEPVEGPPSDAPPVCPRHPDRVAYVRCQRCERPVCPQCQRPAAVGVQCVDCVKEQAKTVRTARTVFGGSAVATRPVITMTIIGLCLAAFGLQQVVGVDQNGDDFTSRFMFVPVLALSEPWRFLTSAFLHSPSFLLHIAFNMYALWLVGPYLESLLGRVRFVAVYLLSALGGSVGVLLLARPAADSQSWFTGVVGASGAVFGLWGALMVINRRLGRDNAGMIALIVINGVIGFFPGLHIAWQGHLGGLVTGAAAACVIAYAPKERRALLHPLGLAAVAVVLLLLVVIKAATVPAGLI
jgi:membrane associated rhomboid family serine protease